MRANSRGLKIAHVGIAALGCPSSEARTVYPCAPPASPSGNRSDDEKRLRSGSHRVRKCSIRQLMRKIFLACEEAQKRPPLLRDLIPNRPAQHGIAGLQRVQHRALRDRSFDFNCTSLPTCASVRRCCGSMTRITPASAPQPKAQPANPAQSEPSYLRHQPTHKPARRWCRNKFRICPKCQPP